MTRLLLLPLLSGLYRVHNWYDDQPGPRRFFLFMGYVMAPIGALAALWLPAGLLACLVAGMTRCAYLNGWLKRWEKR